MIGIVIPVHNEESRLEACLSAAIATTRDARLQGETVKIVAVMDSCRDRSAQIARACRVETLAIDVMLAWRGPSVPIT